MFPYKWEKKSLIISREGKIKRVYKPLPSSKAHLNFDSSEMQRIDFVFCLLSALLMMLLCICVTSNCIFTGNLYVHTKKVYAPHIKEVDCPPMHLYPPYQ